MLLISPRRGGVHDRARLATLTREPIIRRFLRAGDFRRGAAGSEIRSHHHGQPVRLADHEACRRDARCARRRLRRRASSPRTARRSGCYAFAKGAKAAGFKVIIAGAGGAAHLPGMTAALTSLPVFGVPIEFEGAVRPGFALFHRADAAGRAGRHAGDRPGRRDQRRAARGERPGAGRCRARRAARRVANAADRSGRGTPKDSRTKGSAA